MNNVIPEERIEAKIYLIRGQKVMLDRDLAELYQVETRQLKRQVRRNMARFPNDFMFVLTEAEVDAMVCHFGTPFRSYLGGATPFAFTEHGILMLSSILKSKIAIQINIQIMRIFNKFRQMINTHQKITQKLNDLEQRVGGHDVEIQQIFDAIKKMVEPEDKPMKRIGFKTDRKEEQS